MCVYVCVWGGGGLGGRFSGQLRLMSNSFTEPDSLWGGCQPH